MASIYTKLQPLGDLMKERSLVINIKNIYKIALSLTINVQPFIWKKKKNFFRTSSVPKKYFNIYNNIPGKVSTSCQFFLIHLINLCDNHKNTFRIFLDLDRLI